MDVRSKIEKLVAVWRSLNDRPWMRVAMIAAAACAAGAGSYVVLEHYDVVSSLIDALS